MVKKKQNKTMTNEQVKATLKTLEENIDLNQLEQLIQNNSYEFDYKDKDYRVRKVSLKEKEIIYKEALKLKTRLLLEGDLLLEVKVKQIYKDKHNIDIDAIDIKMRNIEIEKNNYNMKMGKILTETVSKNDIKVYEKKINELNKKQQELSITKFNYLETSIETQVNLFTYKYAVHLVTDIKENDKWIFMWKSYDEYLSYPDEKFKEKCIYFSSAMSGGELGT